MSEREEPKTGSFDATLYSEPYKQYSELVDFFKYEPIFANAKADQNTPNRSKAWWENILEADNLVGQILQHGSATPEACKRLLRKVMRLENKCLRCFETTTGDVPTDILNLERLGHQEQWVSHFIALIQSFGAMRQVVFDYLKSLEPSEQRTLPAIELPSIPEPQQPVPQPEEPPHREAITSPATSPIQQEPTAPVSVDPPPYTPTKGQFRPLRPGQELKLTPKPPPTLAFDPPPAKALPTRALEPAPPPRTASRTQETPQQEVLRRFPDEVEAYKEWNRWLTDRLETLQSLTDVEFGDKIRLWRRWLDYYVWLDPLADASPLAALRGERDNERLGDVIRQVFANIVDLQQKTRHALAQRDVVRIEVEKGGNFISGVIERSTNAPAPLPSGKEQWRGCVSHIIPGEGGYRLQGRVLVPTLAIAFEEDETDG